MTQARLPVFYLSHGGGPWPYMGRAIRDNFTLMEAALRDIPGSLPHHPRAVLVISGHWEEAGFAVSAAAQPDMVYDYSGFPEETYHISYPAPGEPALARRVAELAGAAGIALRLDDGRGFDHGVFSMLQPMYPQGSVPVVSMAIKASYDPAEHLAVGRALAPLRDEGVLIIGSGMSYHNLRLFGAGGAEASRQFDAWLRQSLLDLPPAERAEALMHWETAPAARIAHPREDHLIPLMAIAGVAGDDPATCIYAQPDFFGHLHVSSYRFSTDLTPTGYDRLSLPAMQ